MSAAISLRQSGGALAMLLLMLIFCCAMQCVESDSMLVMGEEAEEEWPFQNDGIVNPAPYYERYRRSAYPRDRPYFQWWYFTLKDLEQQRYWAVTYGTSQNSLMSKSTAQGSYVMFASVDHASGARFIKYEKFDVHAMQYSGDFDLYMKSGDSEYRLQVLDDNTYRLIGRMATPAAAWMTDKDIAQLPVSWNVTVHRVYGWYGQHDLEELLLFSGLIGWNSYSHDALVEGTIEIGNSQYVLAKSPRFRAYGDQNWGDSFPTGDDAKKYNWGWYSIVLPSPDLTQEVSIIAGTGTTAYGFPAYDTDASFADIRIGSDLHIGARYAGFWDYTKHSFQPVQTSNDGGCHVWNVTRSDWTTLTDQYGTANIPMTQSVLIVTDHYETSMVFSSKITDYDRLLFAHQDYIFSDFEGLGVHACVTVKHRVSPSAAFDTTVLDACTDNAGVEFGYKVTVNPSTVQV